MTTPNPENRRRMVDDALTHAFGKKVLNPFQQLMEKAKATTENVREQIKPILQAGGWKDKDALQTTLMGMYVSEFGTKFTKEEMLALVTILHVEIMMETIEAAPWGDDKPDLIS